MKSFENRNLLKEKEMKKVTRSIAAIAVIIGSFVVGGNAAFAISPPPAIPTSTIPEIDSPDLGGGFSGPGSFDVSMTGDLDTHCDEDDGVVTLSIENNLSDSGIIPAKRWIAVHLAMSSESEGDESGWLGFGLYPFPVFFPMEKGDGGPAEFEAPSGDYELTATIYISAMEIDETIDVDGVDGPDEAADFVADNDPYFQKTVSVDCSSDDPVEITEDTPEEITEDTPEEITEDTPEEITEDTPEETEVEEPVEGSPLFTG